MKDILALGERRYVEGFALAGVRIVTADDATAVRHAWTQVDHDVAVLILTRRATAALADLLPTRPDLVWTTLPE